MMRRHQYQARRSWLYGLVCGSLLVPVGALAQPDAALIEQYCHTCHNFDDWAGGLDLEGLDPTHPEAAAATWEKVIRKLRAGMMPPAGEPRPERAVMDKLAANLEQTLDSRAQPLPVAPALHRLNRNEYGNAIRDLFGLEVDTTALLPQDDATEGFDNIASGLAISPALIQGYASAAMKISRMAIGDMSLTESASSYQNSPDLEQDRHLDGMPLGTRGGLKVSHHFPLDAEYHFSVRGGFGRNANIDTVITLDGALLQVDNVRDFQLPISAGEHELTFAVVDQSRPTGVNDIYSVYRVGGRVDSVQITGPFHASGPGDTISRERVFSCYPRSNDEERGCAERIAVDIATAAFRQPVTMADIEPVMAFYETGYREGGFERGIEQALARILLDPRFLFRFEDEPADLAPGAVYALDDLELASRLSFFLWSSIPDAELLRVAVAQRLHEPAELRAQVQRMLADPKADALVENFAGQWLYLRDLATLSSEAEAFDENLRQSFIQETELLFGHVIAADRPVVELLDADYSFLNERLARHYGIPDVRGSWFRQVPLPADGKRRGLLGHGSILTLTSTASRTSPVIRGSWILENLLSAPVPAPPPGVETNLDGDGSVELTSTVRERLEAHRADPACASCHNVLDPVGFALENFDAIGAWRERDGDSPVDAGGVLVDGTPVAGPADLREALLGRSELFVTTLTEKLLTYALGRPVEYHDMPVIRTVMRESAAEDYRFSALVEGIVTSSLFTHRVKQGTALQARAHR